MKTILITGCSSGYGLETARHLHAQGWQVIATAAEPVVRAWPGQVWRVDGGQVLPLSGAKCEEGRSS